MDIEKILRRTLERRGIYHSEADFQHHFAWEIKTFFPMSEIRLEYPLSKSEKSKWEYCDIIVRSPKRIGVELKYKTRLENRVVNGESFELKNQSGQDQGRYDFLKDISRLEGWCTQGIIDAGYAIILTNDKSYWNAPRDNATVDRDFRIHERNVSGTLSWEHGASSGTTRGRENPIDLLNQYQFRWVKSETNGFRYLLVQVEC